MLPSDNFSLAEQAQTNNGEHMLSKLSANQEGNLCLVYLMVYQHSNNVPCFTKMISCGSAVLAALLLLAGDLTYNNSAIDYFWSS